MRPIFSEVQIVYVDTLVYSTQPCMWAVPPSKADSMEKEKNPQWRTWQR